MTTQKTAVYIVAAKRTPVCRAFKGGLASVRPDDLLAHAIKSTIHTVPAFDLTDIGDVIVGCAMPEAEQGMNVARIGALLAGLPDSVPGVTINRFCSSGLQAIAMAADRIRLGEADIMLAGGTESMSMVPMMGHVPAHNPCVFNTEQVAMAYGMGITAEKVAERWGVNREAQDQFAAASHHKALAAREGGEFVDEIAPYRLTRHLPAGAGGVRVHGTIVSQDDGPRAGTCSESLTGLRSVFYRSGTVTAGNSSQMSDGAAAVLLASEAAVKRYGFEPLAEFCSFSVAGVAPEVMGIGPVEAVPKALALAGMTQQSLDWIELNEAFAAQSLAVQATLGMNPEVVNPLGGAIALGHPLGATGAVRVATLVHGMRRHQKKTGMVTMCIGTGMGAAGVFKAS